MGNVGSYDRQGPFKYGDRDWWPLHSRKSSESRIFRVDFGWRGGGESRIIPSNKRLAAGPGGSQERRAGAGGPCPPCSAGVKL